MGVEALRIFRMATVNMTSPFRVVLKAAHLVGDLDEEGNSATSPIQVILGAGGGFGETVGIYIFDPTLSDVDNAPVSRGVICRFEVVEQPFGLREHPVSLLPLPRLG